MRGRTFGILALLVALGVAQGAQATCGCDKPPPPHAAVRPFVASADQSITLWDTRLEARKRYTVVFTARDGTSNTSSGRALPRRDFADYTPSAPKLPDPRTALRVTVPEMPLGPCALSVIDSDDRVVYTLPDDQLTVTSAAVVLNDSDQTMTFNDYRAGIGADGTMYVAVDMNLVNDATLYSGLGIGYPLAFQPGNVATFNSQGFEMVYLAETKPVGDPRGWFNIVPGDNSISSAMGYWRHEYRTYKHDHARVHRFQRIVDGEWHVDGTPHIDNYQIVVAISGTLPDGNHPTPGSTPPFQLVVVSNPLPDRPQD